jgi:thiamine pyrophosphokinase
MRKVAIMGNGPTDVLPDLSRYTDFVDYWIGADRGALTLIENDVSLDLAIGDFDSVSSFEIEKIKRKTFQFEQYPIEKDKTDVEIALDEAMKQKPDTIYFFGVTGGRMDHTLINIQLLHQVISKKARGIVIDKHNEVELTNPGHYTIEQDSAYETISFIPFTPVVKGLTLTDFYYPLKKATITMGSTLSISNKLISNNGTFSYDEGIVLVVKSRD